MKQVSVIGSGFGTTKAMNIDVFFDYLESSKGVAETRIHFRVVPWVFRATNMRASAISRIPYTVLNSKGEEVEEWTIPLKQLLYTIEADLCLAGGAFVLKSETLRLLKGLQRLNPWTIKIETDSVKGITSFAQDLGSGEKKIWTPEQMIFFDHFYNPSDDLGLGVSPAEVSRLPANLVNNINNFANNYFENGAIPAVVLETEHQVKKEQQDETRKMWNRRLQGVKNAWNTIVLQRGLKAHVIGHATKDLAMPELEDSAKKQIAIAFGIPLGILEQEDVSHSTAESHQVTFWTDTIIPEADLIAEKLNESLFSNYDYTFSFRFQELEAIQNIEFKKAQSLSTLLREANNGFLNDILSQEEARTVFRVGFARLGFDEFAQLVEMSPPPEIVEEEEPTNPAEQSEKVGDRDQDSKKALGSAPKPVYRELARWRKTENPLFKSEIIPEWYCNTIKSIIDWIGFDNTFLFLKQADARLIYEQRLREVIEPWLRQYEAILKSSIGDSQFLLANDPTQLSGLGLEARIFAEEEFIKHVAKLQTNLQPEVEVIIGNQVLGTSGEIGVAFDPSFVANQAARAARTMTTKLVKLINGSTQQAVLNATATVLETPGMGLKDLFRILTPAFGAYRAELIAVTETTRALSQGVMMVQDELAEAGIPMRRVWTTANDELVCPICGVLNGVPEIDFQGEYPDGSPAHPNCRCEIVLSSMSDQYHRGQATRLAKQREQMLQEIEQAKQPLAPTAPATFPASQWSKQGFTVSQSQADLQRGIEESYLVKMDDGTRAILKPNDPHGGYNGNHSAGEVLSREVAEKMGFHDLVPETFMADITNTPIRGNLTEGSVQKWMEGTRTYNHHGGLLRKGKSVIDIDRKSYGQMKLLDFVSGNTDRHGNNWIINSTTGKVHAIDNGFSWWDKGMKFEPNDVINVTPKGLSGSDLAQVSTHGLSKNDFAQAFNVFADSDVQNKIYDAWGSGAVSEFLQRGTELADFIVGWEGQAFLDEILALQ